MICSKVPPISNMHVHNIILTHMYCTYKYAHICIYTCSHTHLCTHTHCVICTPTLCMSCTPLHCPQVVQKDGEAVVLPCSHLINAAGPWAGEVARLAGIGDPSHPNPTMRVPLPVSPCKRMVFVFHCPEGPVGVVPLMVDPTGVYFRSEGLGKDGMYICGKSPDVVSTNALALPFCGKSNVSMVTTQCHFFRTCLGRLGTGLSALITEVAPISVVDCTHLHV